jgi:hypothetical protein
MVSRGTGPLVSLIAHTLYKRKQAPVSQVLTPRMLVEPYLRRATNVLPVVLPHLIVAIRECGVVE